MIGKKTENDEHFGPLLGFVIVVSPHHQIKNDAKPAPSNIALLKPINELSIRPKVVVLLAVDHQFLG